MTPAAIPKAVVHDTLANHRGRPRERESHDGGGVFVPLDYREGGIPVKAAGSTGGALISVPHPSAPAVAAPQMPPVKAPPTIPQSRQAEAIQTADGLVYLHNSETGETTATPPKDASIILSLIHI